LSVSIPFGTRVLVTGTSKAPRAAFFGATAGIPTLGIGRVVRPHDILFLPQRPYLPSGTLRQILLRPEKDSEISEPRMLRVLHELGLEKVISQVGGLDGEQDWQKVLSLSEQQLLALANILSGPRSSFWIGSR
jgi:vitamin B12/bleomycin/antimicrobial peptide transport system ATP-binding/permease protein